MDTRTAAGPADTLRDLAALVKPNITLLVLITTAGGLWLAPGALPGGVLVATLVGTVGVVAAANTLNCYLERNADRHMARTANRPLPAGRMAPRHALALGAILALLSIPTLSLAVNPLTGLLAALALVSYVWVYTPMKRLSAQAVVVGALPGAMPPLMGWTAATGRIEWPGVALFAIMFIWQMPHFIAISLYRQREYERAGILTMPTAYGSRAARWHAVAWSVLLLPVSLSLVPLGVAGWIYGACAGALGLVYVVYAIAGLRTAAVERWAKGFFLYTLLYVSALFAAILLDAGPGLAGLIGR
jgi:protoheme IX farnesyltransferase